MLSKKNRLNKEKFKYVFKYGKVFYSKYFIIKVIKNNLDYSRFSVVIGVKISKKATTRAQFRRQVYEILRLNLNNLPAGLDYVILGKAGILDLNYSQIKNEVLTILSN